MISWRRSLIPGFLADKLTDDGDLSPDSMTSFARFAIHNDIDEPTLHFGSRARREIESCPV
jgi:hypothetical protein